MIRFGTGILDRFWSLRNCSWPFLSSIYSEIGNVVSQHWQSNAFSNSFL
jgi:hypothetical protein